VTHEASTSTISAILLDHATHLSIPLDDNIGARAATR